MQEQGSQLTQRHKQSGRDFSYVQSKGKNQQLNEHSATIMQDSVDETLLARDNASAYGGAPYSSSKPGLKVCGESTRQQWNTQRPCAGVTRHLDRAQMQPPHCWCRLGPGPPAQHCHDCSAVVTYFGNEKLLWKQLALGCIAKNLEEKQCSA